MSISYPAILGADTLSNLATSRLEIRAYSDPKREPQHRVHGKGFVAPINPASIEIDYANKLSPPDSNIETKVQEMKALEAVKKQVEMIEAQEAQEAQEAGERQRQLERLTELEQWRDQNFGRLLHGIPSQEDLNRVGELNQLTTKRGQLIRKGELLAPVQQSRRAVLPLAQEQRDFTSENIQALVDEKRANITAALRKSGVSLTVVNNEAERISFKLVLTDSSAFHYSGRNVFTLANNYEVDYWTNIGYLMGTPIRLVNEFSTEIGKQGTAIKGLNGGVGVNQLNTRGIPLGNRDGHVAQAIERFLNLTTETPLQNPDDAATFNQPVYLGLTWGRVFTRPGLWKRHENQQLLGFKAKRQKIYPVYLKSVDINYTHFTRDGRALRAELDCVFIEDSSGDPRQQ